MNEERRMILQMVKDGMVSVEEAEKLLEAVPSDEVMAEARKAPAFTPKRIFVLVTENGKPKVNVKVPFSLVRAGLKLGKSVGALGATLSDEQGAKVLEILGELDIDELLDSIADGEITLPYTIVEVDDEEKNQHVTVVLE